MGTEVVARWRAALNQSLLDDALRATTLAGIQKVAVTSPLMQVAAISASYNALVAKGGTLATAVTAAAASKKQHALDITSRALARNAFDVELETLKALVQNNATTGGDITGMGFTLLSLTKTSQTPPDPPGLLVVRIGKAHGKARVSVAGKGYRGRFMAEVSTDPVGPTTWSSLPGTGPSRKLSGYATGTKLWVRFATVRYGAQSDWSTPVLVTIP
jgi:hypothetical protein